LSRFAVETPFAAASCNTGTTLRHGLIQTHAQMCDSPAQLHWYDVTYPFRFSCLLHAGPLKLQALSQDFPAIYLHTLAVLPTET